ncbi:SMC family ATPase [Nitriliruptoraceae bacterium ZYF776]|nr:SMC family ATPase [Profundirhabdus halotolerans]
MRPLRIELEGIGSFRDRTVVDLEGVDLFVLTGRTGAGKTTVIDALILSLYGSVPRYDDRRLVAPIVHQGAQEGRVRLTFGVGPRRYAATRVVRRTKQGATTKEARLEEVTDGGSVLLAGSADEVTDAVTRLLGLSFEQFTRSVVLPQGAFDRFLFAKPADRADLLVQLLDLGLHEEVGKRARSLAQAETLRAEQADRRLQGELADATPEARDRAAARVEQLTALAQRCEAAQGELDGLREEGAALSERAKQAGLDLAALDGLRVPDDLDAIRSAATEVADARAAAERRRSDAEARAEAAETAASQGPDSATLTELVRRRDEVAQLAADTQALTEAVQTARVAAAEATAHAEATAAKVETARGRLDDARRGELVHALTADLHVGDACPVCATPLAEVPTTEGTATAAAQQALQAAEADHRAAVDAQRRADTAQAAADARVQAQATRQEAATTALAELRARTGLADDAAVAGAQERRRALDAELAAAREEERAARRQVQAAATAADEHARRERTAWRAFDDARDAVARLVPPPTDRDDLAAAWETLRRWAAEARPAAEASAARAQAAVDAARQRYRQADGELRAACRDAGVDVASGVSPGVAVADALATARARHEAIVGRVEQVAAVTAEREAARRDAQVADQLGKLLRADGFERWLLNRAMRRLVAGASQLLRELTSGGYSLDLDATNQFLVVDHRNADEPRTVKSLSGGERFLASLALALALADHVAELAAEGSARLESLFLDEGFGTLDPDTLDVVAAALEELGARGRVVGIVTHVRDLAERLPVRFEVRRGPTGSSIRRTDADAPDDGVDRADADPTDADPTDADPTDEVAADREGAA